MKVLIISTTFTGHISPTFNMAKYLVETGVKVDYLTTEKWRENVERTGATLISIEESPKLSLMLISLYKKGLSIGGKYDAIVYDELFFLGKNLCETLGITGVRFFATMAISRNMMRKMLNGRGFMGIFKYKIIRKMWTKDICRPLNIPITDWTEEVATNHPDHNIVFVPSWFQSELATFLAKKYCFVGLFIYLDEKTMGFEQKGKPLVYMALGTIENKQLAIYKKCLKAFASKDVHFILSVGNNTPIKKLGEIPSNCTVVPFAPQKEILQQADLFRLSVK